MTIIHKKLSDINILDVGNTIQLAGVVYSNADTMFLVMLPDEHDAIDKTLAALNMSLVEWQAFIQQTDHLDVETLAPDADGKLVKAIVRKSQRQIDQCVSWKVFKRADYRCEYCGLDDVPLTVDHLITWEDGGPSIPENLAASCRRCNKTRGSLRYDQWLRHPYYVKVSKNLIEYQRLLNSKRAESIVSVPRQKVRSR